MVDIAKEQTSLSLADITRHEVDMYAGPSDTSRAVFMADEKTQTYAVIIFENDRPDLPAYVGVMARVVGDFIVIEEDHALDKPLVDALMVNGHIPREKIILAYKGEKLPE